MAEPSIKPTRGSASPNRLRALLALAPLLVSLGVSALTAPWHTAVTVDERTYLEMTRAVSERGLPRFSNGPVDRFPALQARWNLREGDHLWGSLAPAYPYLAAPLLKLGGVRLLIRANIALLALLALAIFELGGRLFGDPWIGTAAAYLTLVATPVWAATPGVSPYTLAITLVVISLLCAERAWPDAAVEKPSGMDLTWAAAAGLLAGLATASHLLALPLSVGLLGALARRGLGPFLAATAAFTVPLAGVSLINHERFGDWNPVSDGPCVWRGCAAGDPQSLGAVAAFAGPPLAWVTLAILALWLTRRARSGRALASGLTLALGLVAALFLAPGLRDDLGRCLLMTWALLVDVGLVPLGEAFEAPDHGPGRLLGGYAVKSLLQVSPFLLLAALPRRERQDRQLLLVLPVACLLLSLVLRAGMPWDFALGHPFLNLRYLAPALPLLSLLAVSVVRDLPWRPRHLVAGVLAAGVARLLWSFGSGDGSLIRRLLLLRLPLLLAAVLLAVVVLARRRPRKIRRGTAAWCVTAAVSFAAGICQGVDLPALAEVRTVADRFVDGVAANLPSRFALVAYPDQLDSPLSLALERDIEYLDLGELESPESLVDLVREWRVRERPVFILFPPGEAMRPLPEELRFVAVDVAFGLARVELADEPEDPANRVGGVPSTPPEPPTRTGVAPGSDRT